MKRTTHIAVRPKEEIAFAAPIPATSHRVAAAEPAVGIAALSAARPPFPSLGVLEHALELAAEYSLMRGDGRGIVVRVDGGLGRGKGGDM